MVSISLNFKFLLLNIITDIILFTMTLLTTPLFVKHLTHFKVHSRIKLMQKEQMVFRRDQGNKNCQKTMERALWEFAFKMGIFI